MGRHKGKKGRSAKNAQANQQLDTKEDLYLKAPHSFVFHRGHVGKTVKELVLDVRKFMEPYTASSLKVKKKNVMKDFLTVAGPLQEDLYLKAPHSFVFHRGHVGKTVKELVLDVRKFMEPYTASSLKVKKKNVMKDFLTVAGPLHVTHFIVFTKTDMGIYMKLICVPRGPTLTFKVNDFSLAKDVLSFQKHPDVDSRLFTNHAVMVTNIPSDNMEHRLMNVTFKNMFPSINPNSVNLDAMRRTILINYDPETQHVDMRHYTVKVVPTGVSRTMKKLMKTKLPNLGHHKDIADIFLDKGLSDSEGEQDGPHNQVSVEQKIRGRGVAHNAVNAIRLKEIGPRLNLSLVKIEEGFEGGNVMFHALVQKTPEELEILKEMKQNKQKEKLARKQRQEANVKRKQNERDAQKQKSLEGMKRMKTEKGKEQEVNDQADEEDDDDVNYYRQEVGEEPEPEMFSHGNKRKRKSQSDDVPKTKRFRPDKIVRKDKERKDSKEYNKAKGQQAGKNSKFTFKMNGKASAGKNQGKMKKMGGAMQNKSFKTKKSMVQRKGKRK
ncbi:hypothetical protein EGW08_002155 [Elysia chlorotica]|uniref:Brix domain-containing protein n=1 Tax=Elysia chlorotica TaxID=188477 RepID=A0A433U8H2_ELYCH|nr:hypothetical protein EGW08_002155 [Elysia chlorotica]